MTGWRGYHRGCGRTRGGGNRFDFQEILLHACAKTGSPSPKIARHTGRVDNRAAGNDPREVKLTSVAMNPAWLVLVGLPLLLLGALLLRYGLWPKRKGDTPYCRKCGYNLTARVSDRCPECGTTLNDKAIVRGERRRRPIVISLGVVVLLAWLTCTYWIGLRVDWYAYWPTRLLIVDLASPKNALNYTRAYQELNWRLQKGRLSASQVSRLIDVGLGKQANVGSSIRMQTQDLFDLLGDCYLAGRMSDEQKGTFLRQLFGGELRVRPKVIKGDKVPISVRIDGKLPPGWWLGQGTCPILVDNMPTDKTLQWAMPFGTSVNGSDSFPCTQPGRHTVSLTVPVKCYVGKHGDLKGARLIHEANVSLQAGFEVLDSEPADYIKLIRDEKLGEDLRKAITPCDFEYMSRVDDSGPVLLRGEIRIGIVPVGVAFKVVARVNGKDYPFCYFHKQKGDLNLPAVTSFVKVEDGQFQSIDLVFQTYPSLARHTVDLFEVWDGELAYKDVPVKDMRAGRGREDAATRPSWNRGTSMPGR